MLLYFIKNIMYLEPDSFLKLHFPSVQGDTYSCFPTFLGSRISHSLILSGIILVSTMVPFFNTINLLIGFHNFDEMRTNIEKQPFLFLQVLQGKLSSCFSAYFTETATNTWVWKPMCELCL